MTLPNLGYFVLQLTLYLDCSFSSLIFSVPELSFDAMPLAILFLGDSNTSEATFEFLNDRLMIPPCLPLDCSQMLGLLPETRILVACVSSRHAGLDHSCALFSGCLDSSCT